MHEKLKGCLIGAMAMMLTVSISWAKPAPPDGMGEVFESLTEFEEKFESGGWSEALKILDELSENLGRVSKQADQLDATEEEIDFDPIVKVLRRTIQNKDESATEKYYIYLQRRVFLLMGQFDYKVHPVLQTIDKYINEETTEAAEKKAFDEVVNEMREVGSLFMLVKPLLNKKGVTDKEVADFRLKIISVIRAGKAKDANQVNASLKEVQEAYKSLMALFT